MPLLAQPAAPSLSIQAPGDTTLHGDPVCHYWLRLDTQVKETWLRAILSPINMAHMLRLKPPQDRYLALASLAPAIRSVDAFCASQLNEKAMGGAMAYFEYLTAGS
jgi:hypothetical protein